MAAHPLSPLQQQTRAEMNKRWSFLGMDLKKLATPWRSSGTTDSSNAAPQAEKQPGSPSRLDKSDRRSFGKVIPSFGRVKTFKRQQSELRDRLEPVAPSKDERRATSADRRTNTSRRRRASESDSHLPRASAPALHSDNYLQGPETPSTTLPLSMPCSPLTEDYPFDDQRAAPFTAPQVPSFAVTDASQDILKVPIDQKASGEKTAANERLEMKTEDEPRSLPPSHHGPSESTLEQDNSSTLPTSAPPSHEHTPQFDSCGRMEDNIAQPVENASSELCDQSQDDGGSISAPSMTDTQFDAMIRDELEKKWILNLSMHFRDRTKREKFFVTYHQTTPTVDAWRRVTISLDYRDAPENSLEFELWHTRYQRDKSAKIYEAIRESLPDIQFYPTVTNLKLQTTDGRLHVHVVEDTNEIINYPVQRMVSHLGCRRVRENEIEFDSHMSGFVYKVKVQGQVLIKKEIPGPDTVDEFLYEVNALNKLRTSSNNVIQFYGVVVDDRDEKVKGLLISYAEKGALIDIIYDHDHSLPWDRRRKWARQIVQGLSDIHEAGFVQGDFTLSNIVVDENDDAKIIDINRRGCPVGWEPPEATALIETGQRISMYIGVKSDLFQLGMVLWAIATEEDEPESHDRPLQLTTEFAPRWYCQMVDVCLSQDPRFRMQAGSLLSYFPERNEDDDRYYQPRKPASYTVSVADDYSVQSFPDAREYDHGPESFGTDGLVTLPEITTVSPPPDWSPTSPSGYTDPELAMNAYVPTRGRSPPRNPELHSQGVPPRFSWQDNNVATGWESRSTTPRTGTSPQRREADLLDEQQHDQLPGSGQITEVAQPISELVHAPADHAVFTQDSTSGNTTVTQHLDVETLDITPPILPSQTVEPENFKVGPGPGQSRVDLESGENAEEDQLGVAAQGIKGQIPIAESDIREIATPQQARDATHREEEGNTTENFQGGTFSRHNETSDKQELGATVPDIKVEAPESQEKDSGVDTSRAINEAQRASSSPEMSYKSRKDYESSHARAVTDQMPSPRPPASPSPRRDSDSQATSPTGEPMILSYICGNTEPVIDEKRRSALLEDLDAMVPAARNRAPTGQDTEAPGPRSWASMSIDS